MSDRWAIYRGYRAARGIPVHEAKRILANMRYVDCISLFEKGWYRGIEIIAGVS